MGGGGGTCPKRLYGRLLIKRVGFKSSGKGKERGREGERERGRGYIFFCVLEGNTFSLLYSYSLPLYSRVCVEYQQTGKLIR